MAANCCGLSRRLISIVRDRGSLARLECLAPCLLCSAAAFGLPAPMKPPMHAVACFVTPDPEKREELLQTLRSLAEVIRRETGCLVCSVCIEETSAFFIVVSGWASDADLRRTSAPSTSRSCPERPASSERPPRWASSRLIRPLIRPWPNPPDPWDSRSTPWRQPPRR